jgi:hypothetical protein
VEAQIVQKDTREEMLLRRKYSHPQSASGSTPNHRSVGNGKSTTKGDGDGEV